MRPQIIVANWKMRTTYQEAAQLLDAVLSEHVVLNPPQQIIFAVPFPYLPMALEKVRGHMGYAIAAQNCHHEAWGSCTGEVSAPMLQSIGVEYCMVGHSECRECCREGDHLLAEKINLLMESKITPIFCCGEPMAVREQDQQSTYVDAQLREALFHLSPTEITKVLITYEPVWAISRNDKFMSATPTQAQEMHVFIRSLIREKYGAEIANDLPILYGGSVKADNASELLSQADVDGLLVGAASLNAVEFTKIIRTLSLE